MKQLTLITILLLITSNAYSSSIGSGAIGPIFSYTGLPQVSAVTVTGADVYATNFYENGVNIGVIFLKLDGSNDPITGDLQIGTNGSGHRFTIYSEGSGEYHDWEADGDYKVYGAGDVRYTGYDYVYYHDTNLGVHGTITGTTVSGVTVTGDSVFGTTYYGPSPTAPLRTSKLALTNVATSYDDIVSPNQNFTFQSTYAGASTNISPYFVAPTGKGVRFSFSADGGVGWSPYLDIWCDYTNDVTWILSDKVINIEPGADHTDYIQLKTISNVPEITTVGGCNLKLSADSKEITIDSTLNCGTYSITANTVTATSITGNSIDLGGFLNVGSGAFSSFYQDDGDAYIDGKLYGNKGLNVVCRKYGWGLQVRESSLDKFLTYSNVDFYSEGAILYAAGEDFIADGVVTGDVVAISSGFYKGGVGEILGVTTNTVKVSVAAAGSGALASATGMGMAVYNHPVALILDEGDIHFQVGTNESASFKMTQEEFSANEHTFHIVGQSGITGHSVMDIDFDSEVTGSTSIIGINYDVCKFKNGFIGTILDMVIDIDGSTGGRIECMDVVVIGEGAAEVAAIATYGDADVIRQHIGTDTSLAEAYTFDVTFNSVTTAFNSTASNVQVFVSDDDYVLVAAASQFDEIEWILDTTASANCLFTFEYNTADAASWLSFSPADDTDGLQHSGIHRFDRDSIPAWGLASPSQIIGDADNTDLYWVRITRTRNNLVTIPIESTVVLVSIDSDCEWDKVGHITSNTVRSNTLKLSEIASPSEIPASNTAWLFLDVADSHLKIKWDEGTVETLETHP